MMKMNVEWGIGHDNLQLVVVTPGGLVSDPYPASFVYRDGEIRWRDLLGMDPHFGIPKGARTLLSKGPGRIVVMFKRFEVEIDTQDGASTQVNCFSRVSET